MVFFHPNKRQVTETTGSGYELVVFVGRSGEGRCDALLNVAALFSTSRRGVCGTIDVGTGFMVSVLRKRC